jgi:S1-C subfamily serine protease
MPDDDEPGEHAPYTGPPLPPDDRLWRHPSEVAAPAHRGPTGGRIIGFAAAAAVGATGALVGAWALGTFGDRVVERQIVERVATAPEATLAAGTGTRGISGVLQSLQGSLVAIRAGDVDGTGVVLRDDGHILTTAALVEDLGTVTVVPADGTSRVGEVLGADPATDIAVIRVEGLTGPGAVLGSPEDLAIGDRAVVVAALASGSPQVATGVIGGLTGTVSRDGEVPLHGLISTDIVFSGDLDGAALVDGRGAVVGVTTRAGGGAGIHAVPIDLARIVADDIIETGSAAHPWLGIEGDDVSSSVAASLHIGGGAHLLEVAAGSPAAAAGLQDEDVVTELGDTAVRSIGDLITALRRLDPGDEVRIGYLRGGEHHWSDAVLAESA